MGFNEEKCGVLPRGRDSPGHLDVQAAFEPVTRTLYSASVSSNGKGKAPSRGHRFGEHQSEAPALNNSCSLFSAASGHICCILRLRLARS